MEKQRNPINLLKKMLLEDINFVIPKQLQKNFFLKLVVKLLGFLFATFMLFNLFAVIKTVHIITFSGALLSFALYQLLSFFINKFLEKSLNYNDFSYIRQAFSIISTDVLFLLIFPIWILFLQKVMNKWDLNIDPDTFAWKITFRNPFYWIFTGCLIIFSYRIETLKHRLINLQNSFKKKEAEPESAKQ